MHTHRRTCARAGSAVRRGCGFLHRHMFAGETPGHLAFAFLCSGALVRAWALVSKSFNGVQMRLLQMQM